MECGVNLCDVGVLDLGNIWEITDFLWISGSTV